MRLRKTCERVSRAERAGLALAGPARIELRRRGPDLKLIVKDRIHPTPVSTYLAACVVYRLLTGKARWG